jgi:hypothetical protein
MDIGGWLRSLGLCKYEAAFLDNGEGGGLLGSLHVDSGRSRPDRLKAFAHRW